ncbi:putative cis-zeatin O-glucosyltransferase [Phoenix dactylifera]|uniref:Glycosyltransferase n=1 Tax=Phoenix dactylifera TaxID=42345 RepID=A0A8B9AHJ2_PHODC|nr:putative cis-zeatin O-glucosyltransferase [Phoenix dactylifera]
MVLVEAMQVQEVAVVMVPFAAQGHLNQLLHLSLLLSARGLAVHYAAPPSQIRQAKSRLQGWQPAALHAIHFHDLPIPPFSTPPPDPNAATKFPNHLIPLWESTLQLRSPLISLFHSLSAVSRRLVVVYDPLLSFAAQEAATLPNAEVYGFHCVPAFFHLSYKSSVQDEPAQPKPKHLEAILCQSFDDCFTNEFLEFVTTHRVLPDSIAADGGLMNTCRPIEGELVDLLAEDPFYRGKKKLFAIGPLNPVTTPKGDGGRRHACLEWLDKQPPASVVYVSFGTTSTMLDEQINELAIGFQRSGQRFIWVLRDADIGDIYAECEESRERKLPPDYERKVEGVGMVVRGWAPQLEILAHPATGGFMSHCGWNSCMESLSMGVPVMAWPMHSDQPSNAVLVTEFLKVGVVAREWARRKEILPAGEIEESIKRVMVSQEGQEIRRRAKALGNAVREAASEGGSSRAELDSFIAHVSR